MPSRRAFLGSVALASLSGCTALTDTASAGRAGTVSEATYVARSGFGDIARALRERYGEAGVWGLEGTPTLGEADYVGAWRAGYGVPDRADGEPFARADAAALVYRLEPTRYRVWCWAAADPDRGTGRFGRRVVTRIAVEVAPGTGLRLVGGATSATRGATDGLIIGDGPGAAVPVYDDAVSGSVTTGPDGQLRAVWTGTAGDPRAVYGVAEFRATEGNTLEASAGVNVRAQVRRP